MTEKISILSITHFLPKMKLLIVYVGYSKLIGNLLSQLTPLPKSFHELFTSLDLFSQLINIIKHASSY